MLDVPDKHDRSTYVFNEVKWLNHPQRRPQKIPQQLFLPGPHFIKVGHVLSIPLYLLYSGMVLFHEQRIMDFHEFMMFKNQLTLPKTNIAMAGRLGFRPIFFGY